jgi:hypothetical protein
MHNHYDPLYHLNNRARDIYSRHLGNLRKMFNIGNDEPPKSAIELVKRIKAGKYVLPSEEDDYGWASIMWRDPAAKADHDGFNTALAALDKEKQFVVDSIIVEDKDIALVAVRAFENWEYNKNKNKH